MRGGNRRMLLPSILTYWSASAGADFLEGDTFDNIRVTARTLCLRGDRNALESGSHF